MPFVDRADSGRQLAQALASYQSRSPIVLALPRGGVPVAAEIASAFHVPLDLILVRKIGVPRHPELAMGAVVDGAEPTIVRNEDIIARAGVSDAQFSTVYRQELKEIERRRHHFLGSRKSEKVTGRVVIVVDDGIATGATVRAVLKALRQRNPKELVLAVPVAPVEVVAQLRREVDTVICLEASEDFGYVGLYYHDFRQVSDEDVMAILARFPSAPKASSSPEPRPEP
eukprot:gene9498-9578_t